MAPCRYEDILILARDEPFAVVHLMIRAGTDRPEKPETIADIIAAETERFILISKASRFVAGGTAVDHVVRVIDAMRTQDKAADGGVQPD